MRIGVNWEVLDRDGRGQLIGQEERGSERERKGRENMTEKRNEEGGRGEWIGDEECQQQRVCTVRTSIAINLKIEGADAAFTLSWL